jgi:hypothetical protein
VLLAPGQWWPPPPQGAGSRPGLPCASRFPLVTATSLARPSGQRERAALVKSIVGCSRPGICPMSKTESRYGLLMQESPKAKHERESRSMTVQFSPDFRASGRAIRHFIGRVKALDLRAGRRLALHLVRNSGLDEQLKPLALRILSAQRGRDGLVDSLIGLAAFLRSTSPGSPIRNAAPAARPLLGRRVDIDEDFHTVLSAEDVLYAFVGYACAESLVSAAWCGQVQLALARVYVRTAKGIFEVDSRSLEDLYERLKSPWVVRIHQSILVHLKRGMKVDTTLGIVAVPIPEAGVERLTVSRRQRAELRMALRASRRNPQKVRRSGSEWTGSPSKRPNPD